MANFRIIPRNFYDDATLATELAPQSGFSVEDTKNSIRSRVWQSTGSSDQFISGTYADGISRTASFFGLFNHHCHGGSVRLRLYSDAAWTTQVYDSGANTIINVIPSDGSDWGFDAYGGSGIDPFLTESPYWLYFTPTAHKSFRIYFTGNTGTYGYPYWQVGRVWLGKYIEYLANPDTGAPLGYVPMTDRSRSRGRSLRRNAGGNWKALTLDLNSLYESERAGVLDVIHYCGTHRDLVVSLFPGEASRRERDYTINACFSSLDPLAREVSRLTQRYQLEEV